MVRVRPVEDGAALEFFEGVGNDCTLAEVTNPSSITRVDDAGFPIAVDRVFDVRTKRLAINRAPSVVVRDGAGNPIRTAHRSGVTRHGGGETILEICTPLKLYLQTESDVTIDCTGGSTDIRLQQSRRVRLGVRSHHQSPAGTIITTDDVSHLFRTISAFGAAMPSLEPSRSFPTERRHPPLVEFGEELAIPDTLADSHSNITITAPSTFLHAAMAAPLTYFIGATLRPSSEGSLIVGDTPLASLGRGREFARNCTDILRRVLLFDGLLAAEQRYGIITSERIELGESLGVDWQRLIDRPLADRVVEYLSLPREPTDPYLPSVQPVYAVPTRATIESLPFLSFDLTSIRPPTHAYRRNRRPALPDGGTLRTASENHRELLPPIDNGTIDGRAIGNRLPIGQHPAYPQAFRNRLDRRNADDSISITVVCNDPKMREELEDARSTYRARKDYPIDVEVHENLSRSELVAVLHRHADYFHYIGHIDRDGFVCADGHLDVRELADVSVELFFLNSCESSQQAVGLINAGACGGIATHHRVRNRAAISIGSRIGHTLVRGFPLGISLELMRAEHPIGERYSIVGDPKSNLTRTDSGVPYTCHIDEQHTNAYDVTIDTYLTESAAPGSICSFHLGENTPYFIHPTHQTFDLSHDELIRFLELEEVPVWYDDSLEWSTDCIEILSER